MGKKQKPTPEEHRYQRLKKIVSLVDSAEKLDDHKVSEIRNLLAEGVKYSPHLNNGPSVMWSSIGKVEDLMPSASYVPLLQALMPLYVDCEHQFYVKNGMIILLHVSDRLGKLIAYPEKLTQIFEMFIDFEKKYLDSILRNLFEQIMIEPDLESRVEAIMTILLKKGADIIKARTHCLDNLLTGSLPQETEEHFTAVTGLYAEIDFQGFGEDDRSEVNWNLESVKKLKNLITDGARPMSKSLNTFFMGIDSIIGNSLNDDIFPDLLELMDLLMTDESVDPDSLDIAGRNLLHILVGKDWERSPLTYNFNLKKGDIFEQVVSKFTKHRKACFMFDAPNSKGQTPLHSFVGCVCRANKFKIDPEFMQFAGKILASLKTPIGINLQDNAGSTALHDLLRSISLKSETLDRLCTISKIITTESNIETKDNHGRTVVHILAEKVFKDEMPKLEEADAVMDFFAALTSPTNINAVDDDLMSPYSWILLTKEKLGNGNMDHWSDEMNLVTKLDQLLKNRGADLDIANQGLKRKCGQDIADIIANVNHTNQIDEETIGEIIKLKELGEPEWQGYKKLWENLKVTCSLLLESSNKKDISLLEKVLTELLCTGNASIISNVMLHNVSGVKNRDLVAAVYRVLSHCFTLGAEPSETQVRNVATSIDRFRCGKSNLNGLKLVIETYREKDLETVIPLRLDTLSDIYVMTEEQYNNASAVVKLAYPTLQDCISSNSIMNALLFLANGNVTEEEVSTCFEDLLSKCNENWLQRTIMHFAAMYVKDIKILQCIPHSIIFNFINAKDLHGCYPLHLAYLCNNKEAVDLLISKGADTDGEDFFGDKPCDYGRREGIAECNGQLQTIPSIFQPQEGKQHVDVIYQRQCQDIMGAESNVFELMKPMIVLPEEDRIMQCNDVKRLFERLIQLLPDFLQGEVVIAGSSRERLKAGRLDEVDVQIRLHVLSSCVRKVDRKFRMWEKETLDEESFGEVLHACLVQNLPHIKWHDIPLRLISVNHPWQFIYERPGQTKRVQLSVDVVPIIIVGDDVNRYPLFAKAEVIQERQGLLLKTAKYHQPMWFLRWGNFSREHVLLPTYCAYEWDILDSLHTGVRLGVLIVKAFIEISYAEKGGSLANARRPITSYMLKVVLFWLLTEDEEALQYPMDVVKGYHGFGEGKQCENPTNIDEGAKGAVDKHTADENLDDGKPDSQSDGDNLCGEMADHDDSVKETDPPLQWMTLDDLEKHTEEGRMWAVKILQTILDLTKKVGTATDEGQLLPFFEVRYDTFLLTNQNKDAIADLCDVVLGRLKPDVFYTI